jgi:hypothetical protein
MLCPALRVYLWGAVLVSRRATILTVSEFEAAFQEGRLPDWDYAPPNDISCPFEFKAVDWGLFQGRIVATDYANTQSYIEQMV